MSRIYPMRRNVELVSTGQQELLDDCYKQIPTNFWYEGFHSHGGTLRSSIYRWIFPYEPSILGYLHWWKPPFGWSSHGRFFRFSSRSFTVGSRLLQGPLYSISAFFGGSFSLKIIHNFSLLWSPRSHLNISQPMLRWFGAWCFEFQIPSHNMEVSWNRGSPGIIHILFRYFKL